MNLQQTEIFKKSFCDMFLMLPENTNNSIKLWICQESDLSILNYIQTTLNKEFTLERIPSETLRTKIENYFSDQSVTNELNIITNEKKQKTVDECKIVKKINNIISDCITRRASDIHFEPQEHNMLCRARIDGILIKIQEIIKKEIAETLSRIKIMAGLDIAEKRRPQDGRIRYNYDTRLVDIRVSFIPTDFGEKAVLRILDKKSLKLDLASLGFSKEQFQIFIEKINSPNGIILVTGPTGSGKTTTLYAALNNLKFPEVNISTVEDPIEYNLEGINQTQIKPEINLTFSNMLRSLLRQDPNILMVGEIRDRETLDIAIRASLTGHLVLSTVHTNNAIATLSRLIDMGGERLLLSSTIRLIVAQRLVRKNCPHCIEDGLDENNLIAADKLKIKLGSDVKHSNGCQLCNNTGFLGRIAIYEVLPIDKEIKEAILNHNSEEDMLKIVKENKIKTMLDIASEIINTGATTPTEVLREISI